MKSIERLGFLCSVLIIMAIAIEAFADKPVVPVDSSYVKKEVERSRDRLDKRLRTSYTKEGLPENRGAAAKGFHRVIGFSTLKAGVDTVALNTSIKGGKQDISFTDGTTYSGRAWSMDLANRAKVYSIMPSSGSKFVVVSSSATDSAVVRWVVEGD